jgi:raffinose/stachyose/melibiose transport system substrate-binding protein
MNLPSDYAKKSVASVAVANGLSINAQTKYPNEAKTFIDFMARPKQISLFAKVSGSLSPYDATHGIVPSVLKPMSPLFKSGKVVSSPQNAWPNPNLLFGWLGPGITGLFTGQRTIDDVLKGADSMWDNPSATAPLP